MLEGIKFCLASKEINIYSKQWVWCIHTTNKIEQLQLYNNAYMMIPRLLMISGWCDVNNVARYTRAQIHINPDPKWTCQVQIASTW